MEGGGEQVGTEGNGAWYGQVGGDKDQEHVDGVAGGMGHAGKVADGDHQVGVGVGDVGGGGGGSKQEKEADQDEEGLENGIGDGFLKHK